MTPLGDPTYSEAIVLTDLAELADTPLPPEHARLWAYLEALYPWIVAKITAGARLEELDEDERRLLSIAAAMVHNGELVLEQIDARFRPTTTR
jgi:hypothetical protein